MAKNKLGRPTKYKQEYNEQVYNLALLGATDEEFARFFKVTETTINNWKHSEPSFFESIKKGKEEADINVVKSLYKRANGYNTKETRISSGGENDAVTVIEKEVAPDTTAQIFWLKNRQPQKWRDRQIIESELNANVNVTTDLSELSSEDLEAMEVILSKYKK